MSRRAERHPASVSRLLGLVAPVEEIHVAAEVGVYRGKTSVQLLSDYPKLFLYMIDAWRPFPADGTYAQTGDYMATQDQATCDANMREAIRVTEFAAERRKTMKMTSEEASALVPSALDLVFIDAEHSYPAVKQDIGLWWRKIRTGGILCGHDYGNKGFPGVVKAVGEWAKAIGQPARFEPGWVWWFTR